ncbi:TMEM175 family protein [Phenylobacterium sp.]|uniref:TMEM175 family protein n=1 Tax=Phenylobacterium sp. TaxID=1871053 RepID=UPI00374D49B6
MSQDSKGAADMGKERLAAFSDGVVAIIITIMVLELKVPHGTSAADLIPVLPVFLGYVLSFVYVGIYWNNHHHLLALARSVTGPILWANMHLLFWLSIVPFATAWVGESGLATAPVALYGAVLIMNGVAYSILTILLVGHEGPESTLAIAMGRDWKGKMSLAIYAAAIGLAFVRPAISVALYIVVAAIWFIPDLRIERVLSAAGPET